MEKSKIRECLLKFRDILLRTSVSSDIVREVFDDVLKHYPEKKKVHKKKEVHKTIVLKNIKNGNMCSVKNAELYVNRQSLPFSFEGRMNVSFNDETDADKVLNAETFFKQIYEVNGHLDQKFKDINGEVWIFEEDSESKELSRIAKLYNVIPIQKDFIEEKGNVYTCIIEWPVFDMDNAMGVKCYSEFKEARDISEKYWNTKMHIQL